MKVNYTVSTLSGDDFMTAEEYKAYFEKVNPGYTVTGEVLNEECEDGSGTGLVVFKGPSTRYGMCRDCGDHYIIARWDRYDRIDKGTLKVTADVEDR